MSHHNSVYLLLYVRTSAKQEIRGLECFPALSFKSISISFYFYVDFDQLSFSIYFRSDYLTRIIAKFRNWSLQLTVRLSK